MHRVFVVWIPGAYDSTAGKIGGEAPGWVRVSLGTFLHIFESKGE